MKRVFRVLLAPLFFAMICIGLTAPAASANIDTDRVMRATVWVDAVWKGTVEVQYSDNTTERFDAQAFKYCTGFIVSETGHVATAGHCVLYDDTVRVRLIADVIKRNNLAPAEGQFTVDDITRLTWPVRVEDTPTIKIGQPSVIKDAVFDRGMTAQLLRAQDPEAGDNAVVQVAGKDTSGVALPIAETAPKIRDEVTAVGFPGDTAGITEEDRQSPTFKEGTISAQTISKKGVPQLQLDGELIGGMSGGPTLNSAGEVVGINSSGFTGKNQSYISDTETLRTFLEQNGVELSATPSAPNTGAAAPLPAAPQPAQQSADNGWMVGLIVGLVALLLILLGLGGWFFMQQRQKATPAVATTAPQTPSPTPPPGDTHQI